MTRRWRCLIRRVEGVGLGGDPASLAPAPAALVGGTGRGFPSSDPSQLRRQGNKIFVITLAVYCFSLKLKLKFHEELSNNDLDIDSDTNSDVESSDIFCNVWISIDVNESSYRHCLV